MPEPHLQPRRDERGRWLELPPAMRSKLIQPGEARNPTGKGGLYHEVLSLMRQKSKPAAMRLFQIAKLDEIGEDGQLSVLDPRKDDLRAIGAASQWVWEQAWGKAKEYDPAKDDKPDLQVDFSRFTPAQLGEIKRLMSILLQGLVPVGSTADKHGTEHGTEVAYSETVIENNELGGK